MTIEISEKKEEPEKKADTEDVKNTLRAADEYEKLKAENDKLEFEYNRQREIKAKLDIGGKALAGKEDESEEDRIANEAKSILKPFQ